MLEHLPDTIATMEELHRITQPKGRVVIRVPYCNSPDMFTDPTHVRFFSERSFDYFDPHTTLGRKRAYYSSARFRKERIFFYVRLFGVYLPSKFRAVNAILVALAWRLGGVIWVQEVELRALKDYVRLARGGKRWPIPRDSGDWPHERVNAD